MEGARDVLAALGQVLLGTGRVSAKHQVLEVLGHRGDGVVVRSASLHAFLIRAHLAKTREIGTNGVEIVDAVVVDDLGTAHQQLVEEPWGALGGTVMEVMVNSEGTKFFELLTVKTHVQNFSKKVVLEKEVRKSLKFSCIREEARSCPIWDLMLSMNWKAHWPAQESAEASVVWGLKML